MAIRRKPPHQRESGRMLYRGDGAAESGELDGDAIPHRAGRHAGHNRDAVGQEGEQRCRCGSWTGHRRARRNESTWSEISGGKRR